jgi:choline dehydrogenase
MQEIGIPYNPELNNGSNVGAKREPLTGDGFRRVSSYDAYYLPVENRTNLHVATRAQVQSIILEDGDNKAGNDNGTLVARGVVFNDIASGRTLNVTANNEVILSAGSLQTPQILMLSVSPRVPPCHLQQRHH